MNTTNVYEYKLDTKNLWLDNTTYTITNSTGYKPFLVKPDQHAKLCAAIIQLMNEPQNDTLMAEVIMMAEAGLV